MTAGFKGSWSIRRETTPTANAARNQKAKARMTEAELQTGHTADELAQIQQQLRQQFYDRNRTS